MLSVVLATTIAGCSEQTPVTQTTQPTAVPQTDTIKAASSSLGTILVDAQGRTLYYFTKDIPASNASSCNGQCAVIWPIFSVDQITVSPPLVESDFTSITRADGTKQTTYRGWPLYYYQSDMKAGDMTGENVNKVWFVVNPDESVMISQQGNLGSFLTDKDGRTLYYFTKDTPMTSTCTDACLAKWPAFNADLAIAPSILKSSDFNSITRTEGMNQTTYMGRPLYYFVDDVNPGETKGQGLNNVWYVANISGITPEVAPVSTPVPTSIPTAIRTMAPSSGGSGGGYGSY